METYRFLHRQAVVIGGSRGIGFAVAARLVRDGASVLVAARHPVELDAARKTLESMAGPGRVEVLAVDLADGCSAAQALSAHLRSSSERRLHFLINAAGGARVTGALEASWEAWQNDFAVKFWGYFSVIRALVPVIRENPDGGTVVNIGGISGGDPNPNLATASVLNAALRALSKVLADELAVHRIRILNVHPGATETGLLIEMAHAYAQRSGVSSAQALAALRARAPLGRLPGPDDVAALVGFLLSDEGALLNGTGITIDGGIQRGLA